MEVITFSRSTLLVEIQHLLKKYSSFRSIPAKWRCFTQKSIIQNTLSFEIVQQHTQFLIILYRPQTSQIEGFLQKSLTKRLQVKRSYQVFSSILSFWKLINPLNLAGISKDIYFKVYFYIYTQAKGMDTFQSIIKSAVLQDMQIDFQSNSYIDFSTFYDGIFAFLDQFTKSKLSNQYVRLSKLYFNSFRYSDVFATLQTYKKLHILDSMKKPVYSQWMIPLLKTMTSSPQKDTRLQRPSFLARPLTGPKINQRLFQKSLRKITFTKDLEKIRIEKLSQMHQQMQLQRNSTRKIQKMKVFQSVRTQRLNRTRGYFMTPIEKSNPISNLRTTALRTSNLLEDVIEGRKPDGNN